MTIEAPRGTLDVLPSDQPVRDAIVTAAESAAARYCYGRMLTPTFEDTELFARTSGQGSDVVTKEMYTFEDRAGRSLTLRPEATAGIARAYVEHGLHREPQPVKAFMVGPMFRYSAPQKGRYREFWQLDFEAVGAADPAVDAELIQLFTDILRQLGITGIRLALNSIGCRECRPAYVARLREFLSAHRDGLDDDARLKADASPLRVFDTKNPTVRAVLASAPTIGDSLCEECREHFAAVRSFLDAYGVVYELAPTLVRGLDYYTRTVWEFVNDGLGAAQSTICAGGRYDYLVEEIGGPPTPGVGWAAGIERLAMSSPESPGAPGLDAFFAFEDAARRPEGLAVMAELRTSGRRCDTDYAGRSLKGQLTQGQRLGAAALVIARSDRVTVRRRGETDVDLEAGTIEEAATLL
jgi:histidyl-tRNA synthetase